MRIPDQKIDEVRSSTDIVDIISALVRLRKRGKNYVGLCPFHQEKTPSFTVSADKQMYHCFGCGKGGNVFTFVMEAEKISFLEAVRSLAERAGITLPSEGSPQQQSEAEHLFEACKFAGLHFSKNLTETGEGRGALEYFHSRGFSDETINIFGLGYSMNAWDTLLLSAQQRGITQEHLLKAGLIRKREDGNGSYDYFRGRAMFPIFTPAGRVIAFGARKMREDDPLQGKYINSPETSIYSKSRALFGLFQSRESIRTENNALMVEGYADLISLFQSGIQNVVASSGTALTTEQVQLVGRYTKALTLLYDADSAGSQAMVRGVDVALEQGLDVRVVALPEGEDPDSFVRKHGAQELRTLVEQAVSFIDFKAGEFLRQGNFATPERKTEAVRSIVQSIAKIKDELKRSFFVKEVAEKYQIYESVLYRELERWVGKDKPPVPSGFSRVGKPGAEAEDRPAGGSRPKEIPAAERDILKILLEGNTELTRYIFGQINPEHLTDERVRQLARLALDRMENTGTFEVNSFVNDIADAELKSIVTDVVMSRYEISKGWQNLEVEIDEADPLKIADAAVLAIKRSSLQEQIEQNQLQLKEASRRGEETMPYVQRHQELMKMMKGGEVKEEGEGKQ